MIRLEQILCRQFTTSQLFLLFICVTLLYTLYILEQLLSWSTSRIRPSWPCPRVRLSLLPTLFHMYLPCLSWPTQYLAVSFNDSFFTRAPSLTTRQLNTDTRVNNMVIYISYTMAHINTSHHSYYLILSSYFLYTFGQAGWPRPFMSGTITIYTKPWNVFLHWLNVYLL